LQLLSERNKIFCGTNKRRRYIGEEGHFGSCCLA